MKADRCVPSISEGTRLQTPARITELRDNSKSLHEFKDFFLNI